MSGFVAIGVWCLLSWLFVGMEILLNGPLRQGVGTEILSSPRLALELSVGLGAGWAAIAVGLEMGVPGAPRGLRRSILPVSLLLGWALLAGSDGLSSAAALAPARMRASCFVETLLVSLPPWAFGLHLLRRRAIFRTGRAGFLVGAAAAAIPAFWMQLACVTEPHHNLTAHLSPILIVGLLGTVTAFQVHPRS